MSEKPIDWNLVETFVKQARQADEAGDRALFLAARRLVAVQLHLVDGPSAPVFTQHLQDAGAIACG